MFQTTAVPNYRSDIDGLRAIAVLSVIIFHVWPNVLTGGFVGVDVFFVISGFLITKQLLADVDSNAFSLAEFYRRRIKRIAPAMLVVVGVTLVASHLLLLPADSERVAESAFWSVLSATNFFFWQTHPTGYFATASSELPLLHLWSLAVEEQFYVVWPILFLLVRRYLTTRGQLLCVSLVALASFAAAAAINEQHATFAYYMLPTRAGELLLGALTILLLNAGLMRRMSPRLRNVLAPVGLAMILSSARIFTDATPFPGWWTLLPTVGTALCLAGGAAGTGRISRVLGSRWLVPIGVISYSAYLWHWPLLAILRYGYGDPGWLSGLAVIGVTLVLAWATYRYVEQPARQSSHAFRRVFLTHLAVPSMAVAVAAVVIIKHERFGFDIHSAAYRAALRDADGRTAAPKESWSCQANSLVRADLVRTACIHGAKSAGTESVLLWGDSHSSHYIKLLDAVAARAGVTFRSFAVSSCPPVYGSVTGITKRHLTAACEASHHVAWPTVEQYPVIILSAFWASYDQRSPLFRTAMLATVRRLASEGHQVILLGQVPPMPGFDRLCQQKALSFPFAHCPPIVQPAAAALPAFNETLRAFAASTPGVRYADATKWLCPAGVCSSHDARGHSLYYDAFHLSMDGASRLGAMIAANDSSWLSLFADVATTVRDTSAVERISRAAPQ
jgi:peptidoglycan/LPS O-acetylase OafA/YrhL